MLYISLTTMGTGDLPAMNAFAADLEAVATIVTDLGTFPEIADQLRRAAYERAPQLIRDEQDRLIAIARSATKLWRCDHPVDLPADAPDTLQVCIGERFIRKNFWVVPVDDLDGFYLSRDRCKSEVLRAFLDDGREVLIPKGANPVTEPYLRAMCEEYFTFGPRSQWDGIS